MAIRGLLFFVPYDSYIEQRNELERIMNKAKVVNAMAIIVEEAINTLARVHNTTEEAIQAALKAENEKIVSKMTDLIVKGVAQVNEMHNKGEVSLA